MFYERISIQVSLVLKCTGARPCESAIWKPEGKDRMFERVRALCGKSMYGSIKPEAIVEMIDKKRTISTTYKVGCHHMFFSGNTIHQIRKSNYFIAALQLA